MTKSNFTAPDASVGKKLIEAFFFGDFDKCIEIILQEASQRDHAFSEITQKLAETALHETS